MNSVGGLSCKKFTFRVAETKRWRILRCFLEERHAAENGSKCSTKAVNKHLLYIMQESQRVSNGFGPLTEFLQDFHVGLTPEQPNLYKIVTCSWPIFTYTQLSAMVS